MTYFVSGGHVKPYLNQFQFSQLFYQAVSASYSVPCSTVVLFEVVGCTVVVGCMPSLVFV